MQQLMVVTVVLMAVTEQPHLTNWSLKMMMGPSTSGITSSGSMCLQERQVWMEQQQMGTNSSSSSKVQLDMTSRP